MEVATPALKAKELSLAKRRLLEQRLRGLSGPVGDCVLPRSSSDRMPASAEQQRIWLHASMAPELTLYNESITLHRWGSFDFAALEASLNEVLRRHEAWRTSFEVERNVLMQVVRPAWAVALSFLDLSIYPAGKREEEACRVASEDAALAFDLQGGALFRARVIKIGDDHHWLQLTLHHILFDGTSIYQVLVPELAALYRSFAAGQETPLQEPRLQYGDYAVWHAKRLQTAEIDRQLEFWRAELSGELPVLRLPADRPRPASMSHRGAMESFTFPNELADALRSFSISHGATLYMVMLAALKTLFFRYSGQEDIVVGGLADGRRRPELEGLMGNFLQTFAIRTRPSAERSFVDYLREVKSSVLRAMEAAEVPFERVVQAVRPHRDQSHHPLFQTFLSVQPLVESLPDGWDVNKTNVSVQASKFDLYIEVEERLGRIATRIMYSTDLFEAKTIRRMAAHWMTLLNGITETPECCLGDLPLLTRAEQELMLVTWNENGKEMPEATVQELFAAQARRTPDAVAMEFEECMWTYAELERCAEELAEELRRAGATRGELVAVCLERSMYLPAALLAVMKTGSAYLPLDPDTPSARRMLCLEDAAPMLVLTQRSLRADVPESGARMVILEDLLSHVGAVSALQVPEEASADDAAYVIHTSGSTGRPKGVEVSHRALVNLLLSMLERPGFRSSDTLLAVTTISFDIAGLEMFLPLLAGGRVVIASREVALDPYLLAEAIERTGCTVLQATPATWRSLLSVNWRGRAGLRVVCGGEALPRDLAESLLELGLEVWNVYGPTETTIWSTVGRVTHGRGAVPVGRPVANTRMYLLDKRQQAVPIGVQGELYLGGAGVAKGYRGQAELTAERFVSVALAPCERLYRTGDYAIYRDDGTIEIQGRSDNQVKVRGYRIELEDVEMSLCAHPRVAAGAAKVWPDASGGSRLSAYLVGKMGPPPDAAELREFLRTRMPEYMIPSDVVALDTMPLTSNGKMDRKALKRAVTQEDRAVPPTGLSEQGRKLAAIWADLLGVASVGMEDHFFDLGGHSLLVARLQQRILTVFGRKLAMAAIFHAPILSAQLTLLSEVDESIDASRLLPIQRQGKRPHLFWLQPPPLIGNLAAGLGEDQPLLGVTITLDDLEELGPEPELTMLAACYVRTILRAQPRGPYYLGGLCTGGIVAYEVAVQLVAAGHRVDSLTMLDSENPVFYRRVDSLSVEVAKLKFYGRRLSGRGGAKMFLRHVRSRVRRLFTVKLEVTTEMSAIENAILQAAFRYTPPAYFGDVLLLLPRERPAVVDYRIGWMTAVRGRLACVDVSSHHDELLDVENAAAVATALLGHLDELART